MAIRYWVGGAGNWSSTTKWSTTSGGASGASVPTSADDVVFDANSGGKFTSTVDTAQSVNSITITPSAAVGVQQIALSARLTTNNLTTTGTAGNNRIWFRGNTYGIAQDFVINGTVSISDCDFSDIYVIGTAAPISGTRIGDLRGNSGITFSTPKTVHWNLAAGGNWSADAWAATSGGTVSTDNFPLAQDTAVIGDTGLNPNTFVTLNGLIPYIGSIDMSSRTQTMTFNTNLSTTVYGNWTNGSGTTNAGGSTRIFSGRNTQTITSAGKPIGTITIDSYGGTVELADALNTGVGTFTVTNGTFDTKNYNVTAGQLSSNNSNVRAITMGSSTITLSSSSPVTFTTSTNLTLNAGTSTIVCTSLAITFTGGNQTFYNVSFTNSNTGTRFVSGANTFNNLSVIGPSSQGLVVLSFGSNSTINGTLTVDGATAARRVFVRSNSIGTPRTLTVNSLSAQNCDFRDITITGAAAGSSPTRAGDCGGNTGIIFPAAKTVYWNSPSGGQAWFDTAWAASSGGTPDINNFPLAQDTAVIDDVGIVTDTIIVFGGMNIGSINASGRTLAMTLNAGNSSPVLYGNWTMGSGVTLASAGSVTFSGRGITTITNNGTAFNCNLTVDAITGTVQLADALTLGSGQDLQLVSGTFDAVIYNVTTGRVDFNLSPIKILKLGSGTWTLSGTGTVWSATATASATTFYKGTANIVLSNNSVTARTFSGNGLSYNKLTIGGATVTSTTTITGNNQFTELASTKTVAHTIALGTTTQTFGAWTVTGTAGNVVTVTGTGTNHVIAGARVSGIDYLAFGSIGFSATSPGEFYAGFNSSATTPNIFLRTAPAPVTRYWRGGTGTWGTSTANWSATSGGPGGATVPTSVDAVIFDAASNATAYTVTCTATQLRCGSLTMAGPASGNLTWAGTAPIAIHDNFTLPATGLTRTYTGGITLSGSATGRTLTTNGVTLSSAVTVNGVGCGWSLGSALSGASSIIVTNGSVDLTSYNLTTGAISSNNRNTRTIALGSGTATLTLSGIAIDFGTTESERANLTFNANTSQINCSGTNTTINGNNKTFHNVAFTSTFQTASTTINGANTFNNLSFIGSSSAGVKNTSLTADQTINGTLILSAGTDATCRTFVQSNTFGTTRTLTCAAFSGTDADFRDITVAGAAAPVSGTRLGDCKGNSGITFDAAKTVYWRIGAGGNWGSASWSATNGGPNDITMMPLAQDTAVFPSSPSPYPSSGSTVTINAAYNIGTIDMQARTSNTMTLATGAQAPAIYGNWINGTGTTLTGTGTMTFAGRDSQTITTAGKVWTTTLVITSPGGSVTLQDSFTSNRAAFPALDILFGTFDANGFNVTFTDSAAGIRSQTSNVRTVAIGSGTWTMPINWNFGVLTNLTVTGTGTISLTSASAKTFDGGGSTQYAGITLNQGGAGTLTISGNNTFKDISNSYKATGATTINFGTTTQTVGNFTASGEAGRLLTVQGTSATSPATLVLTGSAVTTPDYLSITGVRAYDLNETWYAGANSINNGSLGWIFASATVVVNSILSNFFLFF